MNVMQEKRMKLFGLSLCTIRKRMGIKQREVARLSGLSPTYLSLVENGKRNLNDKTCIAIAQALQIDALIESHWARWDSKTFYALHPEEIMTQDIESHWARWDSKTFYALHPEEIMTQDIDPLTSLVLLRVRHMSRTMSQDMRALMFQTINIMVDFASGGS